MYNLFSSLRGSGGPSETRIVKAPAQNNRIGEVPPRPSPPVPTCSHCDQESRIDPCDACWKAGHRTHMCAKCKQKTFDVFQRLSNVESDNF